MDVDAAVINARRVELMVTIGGHAASGFIAPYLLSFSYTDNAGGKADEVQLELQDRDGRWAGEWAPVKGTSIVASLHCGTGSGMGSTPP